MLPIADAPAIDYIVQEAVESGIKHIILVTNRYLRAIEDYFDENPELMHILEKKNNQKLLQRIKSIENMVRISVVRQPSPRGLGHAVLMAREIVGNEPFAVMLGDDLVWSESAPCLKQLIDVYDETSASVLGVIKVPACDVSKYGVIAGELQENKLTKVTGLVEKPAIHEAPSDLAVIGRYVLSPKIFDFLETTLPGKGNEIQLTDALEALLSAEPIYACEFSGVRYDTGDTVGWLQACIEYTMRRPEFAPAMQEYFQKLQLK